MMKMNLTTKSPEKLTRNGAMKRFTSFRREFQNTAVIRAWLPTSLALEHPIKSGINFLLFYLLNFLLKTERKPEKV